MPRTSARRKRRQKPIGFERLEERALLAWISVENNQGTATIAGEINERARNNFFDSSYSNIADAIEAFPWGDYFKRFDSTRTASLFGLMHDRHLSPTTYEFAEEGSGTLRASVGSTLTPHPTDTRGTSASLALYSSLDFEHILRPDFTSRGNKNGQVSSITCSAELFVNAEMAFRINADLSTPEGTEVIVRTRSRAARAFSESSDEASFVSSPRVPIDPPITISGLSAYRAPWLPPSDSDGSPYQYWKATTGQSFTIAAQWSDQVEIADSGFHLDIGRQEVTRWLDFDASIVGYGQLTTAARWTTDGVLLSYNVVGTLPETPVLQVAWKGEEASPFFISHEFLGERLGDPTNGTSYEVHIPGGLLDAPYRSGELMVRVEPQQAQRLNLAGAVSTLPFRADVRFEWNDSIAGGGFEISRGPDNFAQYTATKNKGYMPFVRVTNQTIGGIGLRSFEVKLSEFRSQGTNPSKDANPGLFQTDLWIPALAAGESYLMPLGSEFFSHNWAWIPDENPIDTLFTTSEGLSGLERDQTLGVVLEVIQNNAPPGLGRLLSLFDWTKTAFDTFLDVFALSQDSERTNTYRYILTLPDRGNVATADVLIEVPASRFVPLSAMFVLKAVGDNALTKAIANLIDPKGSSVRAGFWLAAATAAYMGARERYETAKDPPDPNFTETVELQYTLPIIGDVAQAEIDRHLLLREITAYRLAAYRARNKADGAELAGNAEWQSRQLSAAAEFAVEASRLERRLSILDMLFPQPADEIDEDELAEFTQRIAAEGLPAEFDSGLRAGGFSQPQIDGFRDLLASLTSLPASPPEALGKANQLLAINGFIEGIEVLLESVALKLTQPGASVLPVSAEIIAELDATDAAVQAGYRAQLANDAYETVVFEQLERVQSLLLATNNLPVLEPYLQRAATARVQLMARFVRTADVAAHIDQAVTAGSADAGAAGAVKVELDRAAGAFAAGSQDTAAVAATVAEVVASRRGNGIPVALADDITGWTASVSGKSRLAADSFVLEVGRSYDLDVLANDSTVAGRLVPGSLAIQDAAGLGISVTVVDGKLRLNPTAAMAGRHTVRYSVFDDASYLRNSQAISLTVTTNGIFVSDGQITTDTTTRTGGYDLVKLGAGKLVLDRANTHSGGTVIGAGEVIVRNLAALGAGTVVVNPGARLTIDVGTQAVALTDIKIEAGGLLDVGMGRVVLEAGTFDLAAVRARISAGHGGGTWAGTAGITSTTAAATPGRAVGHMIDSNGNLVVGFAAAGDLDMNGRVDGNDAAALMNSELFDTGLPATWAQGDYDYNGILDLDDVIAFVSGGLYDQGTYLPSEPGPQAQAQATNDGQAVPLGNKPLNADESGSSAEVSPVDHGSGAPAGEQSMPVQNEFLLDAAFALYSSQHQGSAESATRKKASVLIV